MRLLALFAVLSTIALGRAALADEAALTLRVTIPEGSDAAKATVIVGQYGEGRNLGRATREGKTNEFSVAISKTTRSAKVLVYYPGCKFVTAEIQRDKLSKPFKAKLEKLPTAPLTIRLTGFDGIPIAGRSVFFRRYLVDMEYFGYSNGIVMPYDATPDASGVTAASGDLTVQVPDLLSDPLYAKLKVVPGFGLRVDGDPPTGTLGFDLVPNWIIAEKTYHEPVQVKVIFRGKVSGKVTPEYLASHNVDAKMGSHGGSQYAVWLEADRIGGGGGQGQGVAADGTFSMTLSAGKYDFSIQIRDDSGLVTKSIPIAQNYVLGENEDKKLDLSDPKE